MLLEIDKNCYLATQMCYYSPRQLMTPTIKLKKEIEMSEVIFNARAAIISAAVVAASLAVPVLTMLAAA